VTHAQLILVKGKAVHMCHHIGI